MKKLINLINILIVGILIWSCEGPVVTVKRYSSTTTSAEDITPSNPIVTKPNTTYDDVVTDAENNQYKIITIGSQIWMMEDLNSTKYNDGTNIPQIIGDANWSTQTTGANCSYNNNSANGRLYNWHAVNSGKLAPVGWHIPSYEEWNTLFSYIESSPTIILAKFSGYRYENGAFTDNGLKSYWWSTNDDNHPVYAYFARISNSGINDMSAGKKTSGMSVRCIKD